MGGEERETTLDGLSGAIASMASGRRLLVALAGPPGAGKSTCAEMLRDRLVDPGRRRAAILQMDGYHYDDGILAARGLLPRKGAPETFDVAGLRAMLERLKRNDEPEVAVPVFDRALEISRAGAAMIPREVDVLVVEGNYVLLGREPWSGLAPLFDVTVGIRVPGEELRRRLYARWEGLGVPAADIPAKVEANDLPNGEAVVSGSIPPDFVLRN